VKNKLNIGVITSTRADFYLLEKIIDRLKKKSNIKLIISGSHFSKKYGFSYKHLFNLKKCKKIKVKLNIDDTSKKNITINSSKIIKECSEIFHIENLDSLIVLGDRYEILSFVYSALIFNIPIIHIHGGEVTHGSIDDQIRHSISKMSNFHFTSHKEYKSRLIQMGENKINIFNYGSPGIENALKTKIISKKDIEKKFKINFSNKNLLVTYHPETSSKSDVHSDFETILQACEYFKDINFIFTYPNFDNKSDSIINLLNNFKKRNKNFFIIRNFGQEAYFSVIKIVDAVMGNSSSGIIEVPIFKKPTINLGIRQSGRVKSNSILDCKIDKKRIINKIKLMFSEKFLKSIKYNDYSKLNTSKNISNKILKLNLNNVYPKKFVDIDRILLERKS
jgi:GDP/UDP-N,N'-diacetylbacillosamine 2-epimerase (hydrolysing)